MVDYGHWTDTEYRMAEVRRPLICTFDTAKTMISDHDVKKMYISIVSIVSVSHFIGIFEKKYVNSSQILN